MPFIGTWPDSRLKYFSIESKNTKFGVLTKELYKLQTMKKISSIEAPTVVEATVFHHFWIEYELKLYLPIYVWILDSNFFPSILRTCESEFERESYGSPKLEASHEQ